MSTSGSDKDRATAPASSSLVTVNSILMTVSRSVSGLPIVFLLSWTQTKTM